MDDDLIGDDHEGESLFLCVECRGCFYAPEGDAAICDACGEECNVLVE
jgi:hypothetical protein